MSAMGLNSRTTSALPPFNGLGSVTTSEHLREAEGFTVCVYSTTISVKRNASTIQTTCHLPMDLKIFNI